MKRASVDRSGGRVESLELPTQDRQYASTDFDIDTVC